MSPRRQRGFTLVELLLALAIVGALLAIAFGGLRMVHDLVPATAPGAVRAMPKGLAAGVTGALAS